MSCTKGILNDTLETVNQILTRVLPPALHERLAFLSGPSFAAEVRCHDASLYKTLSIEEHVYKIKLWKAAPWRECSRVPSGLC